MRTPNPLFNIRGVPVFVHWSVLLLFPIFWVLEKTFLGVFVGVLAYLLVLVVHEAGHAVVARLFKLRVAAIKISPYHGQCVFQAPSKRAQQVAVAWGGVSAQMLLSLFFFIVATVFSIFSVPIAVWLQPAFFIFEVFNPIMAAFNLIPISPLDGVVAWGIRPYVAVQT